MMNESEWEEFFERFAVPRAKMMRQVERLCAAGDAELIAAQHAMQEALEHYRSVQGSWERIRRVVDVSYFEERAALSREMAAHMALAAAEDETIAILARRHRLALQKTEGLAGG